MRAPWVLPLLLLGCGPSNTLKLSSSGATVDLTLEPFSFTVRGTDGRAVLTSLKGSDAYGDFAETTDLPSFVDQLVPGWDGYRAHDGTWVHGSTAKLLESTKTSAKVRLTLPGGTVTATFSVDGTRVRVEHHFEPDGAVRYNKSTLGFSLPADEHFFGLGERYATVDHRGWSLYSWSEEGALGGGEDAGPSAANPYPNGPSMTYFPVPFLLSNKGYALHLDTTFRTEVHLGSERNDAWRVAANTTSLAFTVYVNSDPKDSLEQFTHDTGRPTVPAPWVWGPRRRISIGDTVDGGAEWAVMRALKMPVTTVDDAMHFLPASSQVGREQEIHDWTSQLHAAGFKVTAYNNPFVAENAAGGAADYAAGVDGGYFVLDPDGGPSLAFLISGAPLYVAMVDFTNPAAKSWYEGLLWRTVDAGYDGWMHDFGEYVPRNGRFSDGRTGEEMHDLYPVLSAQAARDVLEAALPNDNLFYVRGGYTGTQQYVPAVWGGDPEATFDETQGMPAMLRGGLNLGLVGVPYWGSDMTGFKCITNAPRDKEVFIRWLELGAVSPIMEEENACSNPLESRTKWKLWNDQETIDAWTRTAGLHTRLQPYFQVLAQVAHQTGLPLMRHPFLTHPNEAAAWAVQDTFFLGPALYAAPVVHRGVTTREAWLPPGAKYVDLDDGTVYTGGQTAMIPAPLDKLPLLLVEGQLLPMLDPEVQTLAPATDGTVTMQSRAGVLDVQVALAAGDHASLTLADGTQLFAERLAGSGGNPQQLTGLADPSTLPSCHDCFFRGALGATFSLWLNGQPGDADLTLNDVHVKATGGPARLVRWQVFAL